ncbi:hypothetical protein E3E29_08720 [Thermococcus sp. Bubb.Bath]|nr:hypothetical protein [Thermococcus sp. Bubb.Bath]
MVGLGNVWKFPSMVIEYGLSGLLVYLASVVIITGMLAAALETTKKKGYEVMEYFSKEYGKPAFALLFLVFDVLLIGYYSIVGGWTISSMILTKIPNSMAWNISMSLIFLLLILIVLVAGRRWTMDFMVASFILFLMAMSALIWGMYTATGRAALADTIWKILVWKGVTPRMALDMASQAAYSLGLGMGFYLALGAIMPRRVSGTGVVVVGALIDTLMAIGGLLLVATLITIEPTSTVNGSELIFKDLPETIRSTLGLPLLYAFNVSLFLAAMTSMIPIGEVTGRITGEIMGAPREDGVILSLTAAAGVGIVAAILTWLGFDPVGILDGTVSTFILFGGIIEAYAAVKWRGHLPSWLKAWAWIGIVTATILGLYAFTSWSSILSPALLVMIALTVLLLNERLRRRLNTTGKRLPRGHYR